MSDVVPFEFISKMVLDVQKKAISNSGKVGAVIKGINYETKSVKYFSAANIYVNETFPADHAEQLAAKIALLERHYPVQVYVTSSRLDGEPTYLCGSCREFFMRINRTMKITVINPDGTIKGEDYVEKQLPHYHKPNIRKLNRDYQKLCGWHA